MKSTKLFRPAGQIGPDEHGTWRNGEPGGTPHRVSPWRVPSYSSPKNTILQNRFPSSRPTGRRNVPPEQTGRKHTSCGLPTQVRPGRLRSFPNGGRPGGFTGETGGRARPAPATGEVGKCEPPNEGFVPPPPRPGSIPYLHSWFSFVEREPINMGARLSPSLFSLLIPLLRLTPQSDRNILLARIHSPKAPSTRGDHDA